MKSYRNAVLTLAFVLTGAWAPIVLAVQSASFHDSGSAMSAASRQVEWQSSASSFASRSQYESVWARDETGTAEATDERLAARVLTAPTAPPPQAEKIALALIAFAACALWYALGKNKDDPAPASAADNTAFDSFGSSSQGIPFLPELVYDETREFEHARILADEQL
jgi:hypothetical protein